MGANISLRGDWRKLRHKFDRLSDLGQYMADKAMSNLADKVRETLHEEVNSSPPPPNTLSTSKRKGHSTSLLETGGMQDDDSVIVEQQEAEDRTAYIIKGNPNKTHERTGTSYEDILGILEYGDGGAIPPRFLMTKTYDRLKQEIESIAIKEVQNYTNR